MYAHTPTIAKEQGSDLFSTPDVGEIPPSKGHKSTFYLGSQAWRDHIPRTMLRWVWSDSLALMNLNVACNNIGSCFGTSIYFGLL